MLRRLRQEDLRFKTQDSPNNTYLGISPVLRITPRVWCISGSATAEPHPGLFPLVLLVRGRQTGYHYVAQTDRQCMGSSIPSTSASVAGSTDPHHCRQHFMFLDSLLCFQAGLEFLGSTDPLASAS